MHEVSHVIKQGLHHNTPYEHCLSKNKKGLVRCPSNLITFQYSFIRIKKVVQCYRKHNYFVLIFCFFFCLSMEPCLFPYSYQYLYIMSVYICYSSKPSFLWSWTSVQSFAKVNTYTVNQYIDCDYRTSEYHIYLLKDNSFLCQHI